MSTTRPGSGPLRIGRYELHDAIASGGMATVHIGRRTGPVGFSRMVAIKRMHANFLQDLDFVSMFIDEARLAARIRHPNVVPIVDVVQQQGELFLVMEYVQGASLARAVSLARQKGQGVPIQIAVSIAVAVLHGLHAAHEARDDRGEPMNIVHRDVSPQNILVGVDGIARVLDFGIAKARGRWHNTGAGQLKGKLAYMAPEQLSEGEVGRQADIHALGVVLWELLTGRRLHSAATDVMVLANVLQGAKHPPGHHRAEVPAAIDALVMRALSVRPSDRFTTARELALALEDALPIASSAHVGRWLEEVADELLQHLAGVVAEADSQPSSFDEITHPLERANGGSSFVPPAESVAPQSTAPVERSTGAPEDPRRRWARSATRTGATVALAALLGVLATLAIDGRSARVTEVVHHAAAPAAATLAPAGLSAASVSPVASTAAQPDAADAGKAAQVDPAPGSEPIPPVSRRGEPSRSAPAGRAGRRTPAATGATASKADCDPPYTIDDRGVQRLKTHCL